MKPNSIPVVIEYENGIIIIIKNAGIAIKISFQSIFATFWIIETPINISTGAIAAIGTHATSGDINNESANKSATNTLK